MTQTPATLETIDQKLEYLADLFVRVADEQADYAKKFQAQFEQSSERLTRLEQITERQTKVAESLADSVRDLVGLLGQRNSN